MTDGGWPPQGQSGGPIPPPYGMPPSSPQPMQNYPNQPPKKGMSPGRILLIIIGVIILGCFGFGALSS
ncbi:hypothetical protein ACW9HQ_36075, partial [Nocardia gipuzkoensis]